MREPTEDGGRLSSWRDTATRRAIVEFVEACTEEGGTGYVAPDERVAVFDNDGTLWCEKPMPVELGFILERLAAMAADDPALRGREPWRAACEKDYAWLGGALTKHYQGDETDVKTLIGGILRAFSDWTIDDYATAAHDFLHHNRHPTLRRPFTACGYAPMIELLRYLEANGFSTYIASGGDRDFMRPITQQVYGIPPERVIGSSNALRFESGEDGALIRYRAELDVFDDGPAKPVRIWSRIGRRPTVAAGNANGDIPMLQFTGTQGGPALRLLVLHDDPDREFDYTAGAEQVLESASTQGWTVISVKNDWTTVFADG